MGEEGEEEEDGKLMLLRKILSSQSDPDRKE
jgi:hypothetical protein